MAEIELSEVELDGVAGGWVRLFDINVGGMNVVGGINDKGKTFCVVFVGGEPRAVTYGK